MTTGRQIFVIFGERGRNGRVYRGCLKGRGADARTSGMFNTAVFQAMLLYGLDYMFMSTRVEKVLSVLYRCMTRSEERRAPISPNIGA